jgi:hypothetical protein
VNGPHQLLACGGDIKILGQGKHHKKNKEALLEVSMEDGPEVNTDKTKCILISRHQNARQNHKLLTANNSFQNVTKFKYLGLQSRVRFPAGAGNFSLFHRVQNSSGAHPASYPMGTRGSSPGDKAPGS